VLGLEDGSCLHLPGRKFSLLPGSWDTIKLNVSTMQVGTPVKSNKHYPFVVRIFMESGFIDFPFLLIFPGEGESRQAVEGRKMKKILR